MKGQNEIVSENIRKYMKDKDWSQNEFARRMEVSPNIVNKWVRGISTPRDDKIDKMCKLFGCAPVDILTDSSTILNLSVPAAHPLAILGQICAGDGILAEQNFDGYFFVDNSIRADYCLRVEGDSMKDAGIQHGDIAFLKKSYSFMNGEIYAVVFGEERVAVLKRVSRQGDGLILSPCNPNYDPIYVDDALIVGECVGIYHPR